MNGDKEIKSKVAKYYSEKLRCHGVHAQGVGWKSTESQQLRFEQLLKICDNDSDFSINDLGCGYGALFEYMRSKGFEFTYRGYDISEVMINKARELSGSAANCNFIIGFDMLPADYVVESGIFNVRLNISDKRWEEYIFCTLSQMNETSRKGFSFNMMTSYVDFRKDELFYVDPCLYFDYCKRHFSKNVALLHDYGLYEFTILVRK